MDILTMTPRQVQKHGAIASLYRAIKHTIDGLTHYLVAWPGNGSPQLSVHLIVVEPGEVSKKICHDVSETALFCLSGHGEVYLRDRFYSLSPGDIAYIPEGREYMIRNTRPENNTSPFILYYLVSPPQLHTYIPLYNNQRREFDQLRIDEKKLEIHPLRSIGVNFWEGAELGKECLSHQGIRPWNLTNQQIRLHGALFNINFGASYEGGGLKMFLVLWPGFGTRLLGLHYAKLPPETLCSFHHHDISGEVVGTMSGSIISYVGGKHEVTHAGDIIVAPCGVYHGGATYIPSAETVRIVGCAAPVQQELYDLKPEYCKEGRYYRSLFQGYENP